MIRTQLNVRIEPMNMTAPSVGVGAGQPGGTGPSGDQDRIARAGRQIRDAGVAATRSRAAIARDRDRLVAIDAMMGLLEERNLAGDRHLDRRLRARLRQLQEQVGAPLPRSALRASNTARLHAVLMDWQEALANLLLPNRIEFLGGGRSADEGRSDDF